jgi:hypothetical protein
VIIPWGYLQYRPTLNKQRDNSEAGRRKRAGIQALLSKPRDERCKEDGRYGLVNRIACRPPGRVARVYSVMSQVSQRGTDELGVCIKKLTAPRDILGEERIDVGSSRGTPLYRPAYQRVVPGALGRRDD